MVLVLKKLKFWTLYVHIVAQVNHRSLGVKVETNYLRDSDLTPRHSFPSTTFSIFINGVCACLRVLRWLIKPILALNANRASATLKVMTLVMLWLRDIVHLKPKPIAISVLLCKLRSFNNSFYHMTSRLRV